MLYLKKHGPCTCGESASEAAKAAVGDAPKTEAVNCESLTLRKDGWGEFMLECIVKF